DQPRAGARLHGPARVRPVLGGRYQAHRSRHPRHRQGRGVILRTDHVAGGAFVAFGAIVLALSGELPVGSLSMPGAGMLPKLVAILLIVFGVVIVLRGRESAPLASLSWNDLPHAARVVAITAVTMALMLFTLIFGAERRNPLAAAAFSIGVVALTYLLFEVALKTPLEHGTIGF